MRAAPILSKPYNGYSACHYCAGCENGCETHSFFNTQFRVVLPLLQKYPRTFRIVTNAMARSIDVDAKGQASGVTYIDKNTGQPGKFAGALSSPAEPSKPRA